MEEKNYQHIVFHNHNRPNTDFDIIKLEELLYRKIDFDITDFHIVEFYHIFIITGGSGTHTIDFTDYNCSRGTILAVRKDQIQRFIRNKSIKGYILVFTEEFLESRFTRNDVLKSLRLFNELLLDPKTELLPEEFNKIHALINEISNEYMLTKDTYSIDIIRSAIHIVIMKLLRIKECDQNKILGSKNLTNFIRFQSLIEKHFTSTKKVSDYADMMGFTTKTLNNISRNTIGKPAKQIIDEIVITNIKRLLLNSTLSIKEIAFKTGFEEITNIYKYFKKHANLSPELFRKTHSKT